MKRSVFLFWLYSNLTILSIPIVITMIVLIQSQHLLTTEVTRSNEALLNQVKQTLDNQLKDIKRLGLQLSLDPKIIKYMNRSEYNTADAKLTALDLISSLRSYVASNGVIEDLYVYIKKEDFGVTTSTVNEASLLFRLMHPGSELSMERWKQTLQQPDFGSFKKIAGEGLVYVQSLPLQDMNEAQATLVVLLNSERWKSAIAGIPLSQQGSVLIVDHENSPIMTAGETSDLSEFEFHRLTGESGSFAQNWHGEKVTVSYLSSKENDWKYVSIVPSKVYSAKVSQLQNWIYASLLICVIGGGLTTIWLTRRNYRPIRRMVDLVSPKAKSNLEGGNNELALLQSFVTESVTNQDTAKRTIELQQRALKSHFLARLLKGRVESGPALSTSLESFDIRFETNRFAVLLFHIGDFEELFKKSAPQDDETKLQFVHHIVTNITEELIGNQHRVFATEVDGMIAFLVNVVGNDEQLAKEELMEAAQEAQSFILHKFFIHLTIGISNIHPLLTGIRHGFEEALEALEYKFVIGPSQIIVFERIKQPKAELYYPLDTERQLINHIKTGQYEEAVEVLNGIIMTNVSDGTLSLQLGKLLMFELIGTILKAIEHIQLGSNELNVEKNDLIKLLTECESFAEIEEEIYMFLKTVCDYMETKKKSHNTELKDQLVSYIQEHLSDMDLSLTSLSLEFNVNAPYLSRFFKEQTGDTFIDFVSMKRVELAKRLLTETDESINEITLKAGFSNSNTFIRVFKRYEGITPGQFRKNE